MSWLDLALSLLESPVCGGMLAGRSPSFKLADLDSLVVRRQGVQCRLTAVFRCALLPVRSVYKDLAPFRTDSVSRPGFLLCVLFFLIRLFLSLDV